MLIQPEEGGKESYDRFRGRLMIPIRDPRGRVIGFGGRILGEGEPKYLNSPADRALRQGPHALQPRPRRPRQPHRQAADRRRRLYGRDRARPRRHRRRSVAPNGTALTEAQLERLWRLDPSPILCFDGDSAGSKAAIRAALRALPLLRPDRTLRFVELPAGPGPRRRHQRRRPRGVRSAARQPGAARRPTVAPRARGRAARHPRSLGGPQGSGWSIMPRTIGHADLARIYREDWLDRFFKQRRPEQPQRAASQSRGTSRTAARAAAPPAGDRSAEHSQQRHRCADCPRLILGFAISPRNCPPIASSWRAAIADRSTASAARRAGQRRLLGRGA